MTIVPTRIDLIKMLPAGTVIAEVGTWRGYLAIQILNECPNIKQLWCVDAWKGQTGVCTEEPKSDEQHEADYQQCLHHLRGHLPSGRVKIVRGFSLDVAVNDRTIPPLTAAYIDADHSYAACLADLIAWSKRLTPGGVLLGHDYKADGNAAKWNFGVIPAVTDFCASYGWELTHLTAEDFASFRIECQTAWTGAEL